MKALTFALLLSALAVQSSSAQQAQPPAPPTETIKTAATHTPQEQELIDLSNKKWGWMADKDVASLDTLFDSRAMFTHMGRDVG